MRRFALLCRDLDRCAAEVDQLAALRAYLAAAADVDAAWAVSLLVGGRPRRLVPAALLRDVACTLAGVDGVLFDACRRVAGNLAQTVAHIVPVPKQPSDEGLAHWMQQHVLPLRGLDAAAQVLRLTQDLCSLDVDQGLIYVQLVGGGFRAPTTGLLLQRALATHAGIGSALMAQRLAAWGLTGSAPDAAAYRALVASPAEPAREGGQPYPFGEAAVLTALPSGQPDDWLVTWQVDRPCLQVVKRGGRVWIWRPGDELVSDPCAEIVAQAARWPDGTVVEGEQLAEMPAHLLGHDLLEAQGQDLRARPLRQRRQRLQALLEANERTLPLWAADWPTLEATRRTARGQGADGLRLQRLDAPYGQDDWIWPADPLTARGLLAYVEGHGPTSVGEGTLALWSRTPAGAAEAQTVIEAIVGRQPVVDGGLRLLPVAKLALKPDAADPPLIADALRAQTVQRFGPVHSLRPTLVFEFAFDGILPSRRHKCGFTLRAPRLLRLCDELAIHEADAVDRLRALMAGA